MTDVYCHTCKRSWPQQMEAVALQKELAPNPTHELFGSALEAGVDPLQSNAALRGCFDYLMREFMRKHRIQA